jgi:hypothetical protein
MKRKGKLRAIKKALRKPDLYSNEEYNYLMSGFYDELLKDELRKQNNKRKGFGYGQRETGIGDSESGGDDGLCSESEQPEQPGEPEGSRVT